MNNTKINIKAGHTEWEFVCKGKDAASMIGAAITKMEEEYGEGVVVTITAQATSEETNV